MSERDDLAEQAFQSVAYEPTDPKSPGWAERQLDRADEARS